MKLDLVAKVWNTGHDNEAKNRELLVDKTLILCLVS